MLRRFILAGALIAPALLATACDEGTGPEGSTSVATVRAYVDADGSGAVSAGDALVSGATITLVDTRGGSTLTAQTDASGVARFDALPAGSYSVTMSGGTVPAGAVLATATSPTLVAPFRGDSVSQEFRFVLNPGTLTGQLFRDNNANGVFDTGDTPAPGMTVRLFSGTDTTAAPVATSSTDDAGEFTFTTLRPGAYTVVVTPLPTMTLVGGNVQQVTVGSGTPTAFDVLFTGNLISSISAVRAAAPGSVVAFEGIATVAVGVFSTNQTSNQFNVQDATGGILILQVPVASGIQQGDSVRVVGTTAISAGEFLVTGNPVITRLASGRTVPAPVTITAARVVASTPTEPLQGSLVKVDRVRADSLGSGATAYNVFVSDGANGFIVRVSSGVPRDTWTVGNFYNVTGTLAAFNAPQVKVRGAGDITAAASSTPIAQARLLAAGTVVTVEGVATAGVGVFSTNQTSNQFNVQDATGGILVLQVPVSSGVQQGDSVRVTGTVAVSSGELLLTTNPTVTILASNRTVPAPQLVSAAQVAASGPTTPLQGSLVQVRNVRLDSLGSGTTAYNVFVTGTDGARFIVRVSSGVPRDTWTAGSIYNVTGTLAAFNAPQVKVRGAVDVTPGTAGVQTIAEARTVPFDDVVTVEGVVTVAQGTYRTDNVYIQDPTSGIQVFGVPAATDLEIGDLIRVTGTMRPFNGERQVSSVTGAPLVVTRIGQGAVPAPLTLTGAQVLANTFEGQLARVLNIEVTVVQNQLPTGTGSYNVTVRAPDGTTFTVRIENRAVDIASSFFVVGGRYDVTGALGSFNGGGQLKPRSPADAVRR